VRDLPTRWRQCRVDESFTHKLAAWEICPQHGGVSENLSHKMAAWEICPQDGGDKQDVNKNNTEEM